MSETHFTGEQMRKLREAKGLSRPKLARLLDKSEDSVANWEAGRTFPDGDVIGALADALGVEPGVFFTRELLQNAGVTETAAEA